MTLIGLTANTFANEAFTPENVAIRFNQSVAAGASYLYFAPKWSELETSPGVFNWTGVDAHLVLARSAAIPLCLNLRVVDTNQRTMPSDLSALAFSHATVISRLEALIVAMAPRLEDDVAWVMIGNEVNAYFGVRAGEVAAYRTLFTAASAKFKDQIPGLQVSISVTFSGMAFAQASLLDLCDFLAVTYYPLTSEWRVRHPGQVKTEMGEMVTAAGVKKVLMQEAGYPSAYLNYSSQCKQMHFVRKVFTTLLRSYPTEFLAVSFLFMADFSDALVDEFAQYYELPDVAAFKSFLKTLGMFDDQGVAKRSWAMFQQYASTIP